MEIATIELASMEVATITTLSYIPYHILTLHEIIIAYETNDSWTNDWSKRRGKKKNEKFPKVHLVYPRVEPQAAFPRERASASSQNCESRRDAHLLIPAYLCWCGCYQGRACRQESKRRTGSGQRDCLLACQLGSFPISLHSSPTPLLPSLLLFEVRAWKVLEANRYVLAVFR